MVRRQVVTAGTAAAVTGDILQKTRRAMTVIQSNGYNANVLAIDPAGAENLDLLRSSGSERVLPLGPGQGRARRAVRPHLRIWMQAGTALMDSAAFGQMYIAPVELRAFEQDAGQTNRTTYRMETNATYTVERLPAALRIL